MKTTYVKFRFLSTNGATAGLVIDLERFERKTISDLSRFFPYSESNKMAKLQVSPEYPSWEEAFNHDFNSRNGNRAVANKS